MNLMIICVEISNLCVTICKPKHEAVKYTYTCLEQLVKLILIIHDFLEGKLVIKHEILKEENRKKKEDDELFISDLPQLSKLLTKGPNELKKGSGGGEEDF